MESNCSSKQVWSYSSGLHRTSTHKCNVVGCTGMQGSLLQPHTRLMPQLNTKPHCIQQYTGKNDITRCITHTEAVFGLVIHSIFDMWHYEVLCTCALTRLLWYTCDYARLILYIMLHSTNLKQNCQMHFFACSQVLSELHSWLHSIVHSQPAWLTLSRRSQVHSWLSFQIHSHCTRWRTPSLLDCTLPSKLLRRAQAYSEYAPKYTSTYVLKYTPGHNFKDAPNCTWCHTPSLLDCTLPSKLSRHSQVHLWVTDKYAPNCTWWYTPSLLGSMLPSTLSRRKTLPMSLANMLPCKLPHDRSRDLLSCGPHAPGRMSCRIQALRGVR